MNLRPLFRVRRFAMIWCFALVAVLFFATVGRAQTSQEFPIFGLQFSPDGKYLAASTSSDNPPGSVVIWDVNDWSVQRILRSSKGIIDVDFSRDGAQLAYATKGGLVGILEVATGKLAREINADSRTVYSAAFSPDGKLLASGGMDRTIKLWITSSGELLRTLKGHTDTVTSVAISPDGSLLLSGSNDREARLWDLNSGAMKTKFKARHSIVRRVGFSRDGTYLLISSWGGEVCIRETETARLRAVLKNGTDCAEMTRDNRVVATSGRGSTAEVFAVGLHGPTPEEQQRIAAAIDRLRNESYDARESAVSDIVRIGMIAEPQLRKAMNHQDAEVRVRSRRLRETVLSPEPIARLSGHRGDVEVVSFSPDGRFLATACRGGDIKVWNTKTFSEVLTLSIPADGTRSVDLRTAPSEADSR